MIDKETLTSIVDNVSDESDAFTVMHALRTKFGMVGSEFCREDVATIWNDRFDDGDVDREFSDDHWDICLGLRTWNRTMQDRMIETGHEVIYDWIIPEIDREFNVIEAGEED